MYVCLLTIVPYAHDDPLPQTKNSLLQLMTFTIKITIFVQTLGLVRLSHILVSNFCNVPKEIFLLCSTLHVGLEAAVEGDATLIVSYVVSNASWSSTYDVRVFTKDKTMKV